MRRRTFLTVAGMTLLAGCSGDDDGAGEAPTDQTTEESTGSPTPESATETTAKTAEQTETDRNEANVATGAAKVREQAFEVHEDAMVGGHGVRVLVENTGDGALSYVELTAKFFDDEETVLESSLTNISWLEPGETWEAWIGYPGNGEEDGVAAGTAELSDQSSFAIQSHPAMELQDHGMEKSEYSVDLVGTTENTSDSRLDYVEALGKFYDGDGNVVSTGLTNVQNVDPGETWQFSIPYATTDPTAPDAPAEYSVLITE